MVVQLFPFVSFNSFAVAWQKASQSASTGGGLHRSCKIVLCVDEGPLHAHLFSSQRVNSSAPSLMIAPGKASLNCGFSTRIDVEPRRPTSTALRLSTAMKFLSPSMMPLRLLSCKLVTMLWIGYHHLSAGSPEASTRSPNYHTAPAVLPAVWTPSLHWRWYRVETPVSCLALSNRIGRGMLHTTSYAASSFCCCRRHVQTTVVTQRKQLQWGQT